MQDSLQMLQLKFAAREQLCRNLQEKVYIQKTCYETFQGFDIILRTRRVFTHGLDMFLRIAFTCDEGQRFGEPTSR